MHLPHFHRWKFQRFVPLRVVVVPLRLLLNFTKSFWLKDVDDLQTPPRLGNITLDVSLSSANMPPSSYTTENICSLIKTHKHSNAYIYLHPKYSTPAPLDPSDVDDTISSQPPEAPIKILLRNLQRAAVKGNDCLVSSGRNKYMKRQNKRTDPTLLYLRCQCAGIYTGDKVDSASGKRKGRDDYRKSTITKDRKNGRSGKKGKQGSHRTDSVLRFNKSEQYCRFQFSVYQNSHGYYIKSGIGNPEHQFHEARFHLRMPSKLVENQETTIVQGHRPNKGGADCQTDNTLSVSVRPCLYNVYHILMFVFILHIFMHYILVVEVS